MNLPAVVAAVDDLYRATVIEPDRWNEEAFADWSVAITEASPESAKRHARSLRRCLRVATKLARFWASPGAPARPGDWQAGVDMALGVPAWRPTLEIAVTELNAAPTPELYAHVAERFRLVTNEPFASGATYEAWLAQS